MSDHDAWAYGSYVAAFVLAIAGYFAPRKNKDKPRQFLQLSVLFFGLLMCFVDLLPASSALNLTETILAIAGVCGTTLSLALCGVRGLWKANEENAFPILLALAHNLVAISVFGVGFDTD